MKKIISCTIAFIFMVFFAAGNVAATQLSPLMLHPLPSMEEGVEAEDAEEILAQVTPLIEELTDQIASIENPSIDDLLAVVASFEDRISGSNAKPDTYKYRRIGMVLTFGEKGLEHIYFSIPIFGFPNGTLSIGMFDRKHPNVVVYTGLRLLQFPIGIPGFIQPFRALFFPYVMGEVSYYNGVKGTLRSDIGWEYGVSLLGVRYRYAGDYYAKNEYQTLRGFFGNFYFELINRKAYTTVIFGIPRFREGLGKLSLEDISEKFSEIAELVEPYKQAPAELQKVQGMLERDILSILSK